MAGEFEIRGRRSPCDPEVLHDQAAGQEDRPDHPQGETEFGFPEWHAVVCADLEVHVHDGVGKEDARDGVPGPALDPPGCDDEDDECLDAPGGTGVGDDHHGHVDGVGLSVDHVDDPEGLAGEGGAAGLG